MKALIIGTGSIGRRHMANLQRAVPATEFTLLRRAGSQELAGLETAVTVTSMQQALASEPDLAILATPSALHFPVLADLIAARVPTYVEKPIVTRAEEVRTIRQALAEQAGVPHASGFNLRLLPSLQAARSLVATGALGTVVRASFVAGQWLPDWRKGQDHRTGYSARTADGGGVIFDLSHELDAARSFLGEIVLSATVSSRAASLEIESEGVAVMLGRSTGGAIVSVSVDYVSRLPVRRYEIVGDAATLVWDLSARRMTLASAAGASDLDAGPSGFDVGQTYVTAMQAFAASVTDHAPTGLQDLEDGLRSSELAISAHHLDASN